MFIFYLIFKFLIRGKIFDVLRYGMIIELFYVIYLRNFIEKFLKSVFFFFDIGN